jgi:hypothetical protein
MLVHAARRPPPTAGQSAPPSPRAGFTAGPEPCCSGPCRSAAQLPARRTYESSGLAVAGPPGRCSPTVCNTWIARTDQSPQWTWQIQAGTPSCLNSAGRKGISKHMAYVNSRYSTSTENSTCSLSRTIAPKFDFVCLYTISCLYCGVHLTDSDIRYRALCHQGFPLSINTPQGMVLLAFESAVEKCGACYSDGLMADGLCRCRSLSRLSVRYNVSVSVQQKGISPHPNGLKRVQVTGLHDC